MAKKLAHISEDHSREQTVYEHLTGTAELAKQFAAAFGAEEDGYLLGLLHDIGKYSDAFQHRLDGGVRVDHSTAGAKEACAHGVGGIWRSPSQAITAAYRILAPAPIPKTTLPSRAA